MRCSFPKPILPNFLCVVAALWSFSGYSENTTVPPTCEAAYCAIDKPRKVSDTAAADTDASLLVARDGQRVRREDVPKIDGYTVLELLGKGGEGFVYRVKQGAEPTSYAAKVTPRAAQEHAALVRVHATDHPGRRYVLHPAAEKNGVLITEFAGRRLSDFLEARGGWISPSERTTLIAQLREAVAAVHQAGLIHGDIKPQNILITERGELRLADFGIATNVGDPHRAQGTKEYASPNQWALGKAETTDDALSLERTIDWIEKSVPSHPPITESEAEQIAGNVGLSLASFRQDGKIDGEKFRDALAEQVRAGVLLRKGEDQYLLRFNPHVAKLVEKLEAGALRRRVASPALADNTSFYQLALAEPGRAKLAAARAEILARFAEVQALAREKDPDWEKMAKLLGRDSVAFDALGMRQTVGKLLFYDDVKTTEASLWSDIFYGFSEGTRSGQPFRYFRERQQVTTRTSFKYRYNDREYDLFDDALLRFPDAVANVRLLRTHAYKAASLAATEELGHMLQDMNLLLDGKTFIATDMLAKVRAARPGVAVQLLPVASMDYASIPDKVRDEATRGERIVYTLEADVYLQLVRIYGLKHVPEYMRKESYDERKALSAGLE